MDGWGKFRILVYIASFIMFCIQCRTAFLNLVDPPQVDSTYHKNIEDVELPIITICPTLQVINNSLNFMGYWHQRNILTGKTRKETSWGRSNFITYENLLIKVFNITAAKDIRIFYKYSSLIGKPEFDEEIVFLPRYGFCKEISNFRVDLELSIFPSDSFRDVRIFLTDRNFRTLFSLDYNSHKGEPIIVSSGSHMYDVDIEINSECKVKENADMAKVDFGKCVDDMLQDVFVPVLGCIPPWMSFNNQCNGTYKDKFAFKVEDFDQKYVDVPYTLRNMEIERRCRKFCAFTKATVLVRERLLKGPPKIYITFNKNVKVTEKIFSYGPFQFIIDVGSSVGLWLGLSVLGFYDLSVQMANNVQYFKLNKMAK